LSYNISATETAASAIEAFKRAFKVEPDAQPMIHTDRGAAYCSMAFNDGIIACSKAFSFGYCRCKKFS